MENLFWDVEFDGTAKARGSLLVSITLEVDANPPGSRGLAIGVFVFKGMTPDEKAQATVNAIRTATGNLFTFEFDAPDDDFKIKVRNPGPNERSILHLSVQDRGTGEDIEAVKDDPGDEPVLTTAFFSVMGKGRDRDGLAKLQIGQEYPLVQVKTHGRTGSEITLELIEEFNRIYEKLGFCAGEHERVPGIAIEKVPCPLGIRAGTTDTGLICERGLMTAAMFD